MNHQTKRLPDGIDVADGKTIPNRMGNSTGGHLDWRLQWSIRVRIDSKSGRSTQNRPPFQETTQAWESACGSLGHWQGERWFIEKNNIETEGIDRRMKKKAGVGAVTPTPVLYTSMRWWDGQGLRSVIPVLVIAAFAVTA